MATSLVFDLIDRFVELWPPVVESLNANITDGYDLSQDYSNFVMVGVEDPNSQLAGQSASAQQSFATLGQRNRDEAGEVVCATVVARGDSDMKQARADCKAITDRIEDWVRNVDVHGSELNTPGLQWIGFGSDIQLLQDQTNQGGAVVTLIFRIAYKARI